MQISANYYLPNYKTVSSPQFKAGMTATAGKDIALSVAGMAGTVLAIQNLNINDTEVAKASTQALTFEEKAEMILNRSIAFGPDEYKNLSEEDLNILRGYTEHLQEYSGIKYGKMCSDILHEKYPNGFTFVSVGRSPAHVAKYLEFQGEDVKYCPGSNLDELYQDVICEVVENHNKYKLVCLEKAPETFASGYKKYLDSIGLTQEFVENTKKPIIVSDYCHSGDSLSAFKKFIEEVFGDKIEKFKFLSLTPSGSYDYIVCDREYAYNLHYSQYKYYSPIPETDSLSTIDEFFNEKYYKNGNRFEETLEAKKMNFAIADSIYSQ